MSELNIRRAAPGDAAAVLAYLNLVGGESDNLLFGANAFADFPLERERQIIEDANQGGSAMLLGLDNGDVVSVCMLSVYSRARVAHRGSIALSVRRDHWRCGVGSAMLRALIEHGRQHGVTVFELTVRADNVHAIALYEKLGFKQIGYYEKEVLIDGVYHDALLMNLYL